MDDRRGLPGKGTAGSALPWPAIGLALLFAAALAHQASWQLTGLFRPQFVAFMQSTIGGSSTPPTVSSAGASWTGRARSWL